MSKGSGTSVGIGCILIAAYDRTQRKKRGEQDETQQSYEPNPDELADARSILDPDVPAVFSSRGDMLEPACHSEWARRLIDRDSLYRSASQVSPQSCKRRQKL